MIIETDTTCETDFRATHTLSLSLHALNYMACAPDDDDVCS